MIVKFLELFHFLFWLDMDLWELHCNSLEQLKIISNKEKNLFLNNIRTIATDMIEDLNNINNDKNKKLVFTEIRTFETRDL